jgi:hypothetical protein
MARGVGALLLLLFGVWAIHAGGPEHTTATDDARPRSASASASAHRRAEERPPRALQESMVVIGPSMPITVGVPARPRPGSNLPTLSWFPAGDLPSPTCLGPGLWDSQPSHVHPLHLLALSSLPPTRVGGGPVFIDGMDPASAVPGVVPPPTITTATFGPGGRNDTLFLLGAYTACRGAAPSTYPILSEEGCEVAQTFPVLHRSTDHGLSWTCEATVPPNVARFGAAPLVFRYRPEADGDDGTGTAGGNNGTDDDDGARYVDDDSIPPASPASPEPLSPCELMCVFGGMRRIEIDDDDDDGSSAPVPSSDNETYSSSAMMGQRFYESVANVSCCRLPECAEWFEESPLPNATRFSTAVQFGNAIYVVGGEQEGGRSSLYRARVNATTCRLQPQEEEGDDAGSTWSTPILDIPMAPRRIGVMVTEAPGGMLVLGGGITISNPGVEDGAGGGVGPGGDPLYPNPDVWSTATPDDATSWRMLTPSLPAGDPRVGVIERLTAMADVTTFQTYRGTPASPNPPPYLPLSWVYSGQKAYLLRTDLSPPSVITMATLVYPSPTSDEPLLSPLLRSPVAVRDPLLGGYGSIFSLPASAGGSTGILRYSRSLIRADIVRCNDMCDGGLFTSGCVRGPLDALCYPCATCGEGTRETDRCRNGYLGYGDTVCSACAACPSGFAPVPNSCNATSDTVCEPLFGAGGRTPPGGPAAADLTTSPAVLRGVYFSAAGSAAVCVGAALIMALFSRKWGASKPDHGVGAGGAGVGAGRGSGRVLLYSARFLRALTLMRALWPVCLSVASALSHLFLGFALLGVGLGWRGWDALPPPSIRAPSLLVVLFVVLNTAGNAAMAVALHRTTAGGQGGSGGGGGGGDGLTGKGFLVASIESDAGGPGGEGGAVEGRAHIPLRFLVASVVHPRVLLALCTSSRASGAAAAAAGLGPDRGGGAGGAASLPLPTTTAGGGPSAAAAASSAAASASSASAAAGTAMSSSSYSLAAAAVLSPLYFHHNPAGRAPRTPASSSPVSSSSLSPAQTRRLPYYVPRPAAPASGVVPRALQARFVRWAVVSTITYDAPLVLCCLNLLGIGIPLRTASPAVVLCTALSFVGIVITLSWSASVAAKLKASALMAEGLGVGASGGGGEGGGGRTGSAAAASGAAGGASGGGAGGMSHHHSEYKGAPSGGEPVLVGGGGAGTVLGAAAAAAATSGTGAGGIGRRHSLGPTPHADPATPGAGGGGAGSSGLSGGGAFLRVTGGTGGGASAHPDASHSHPHPTASLGAGSPAVIDCGVDESGGAGSAGHRDRDGGLLSAPAMASAAAMATAAAASAGRTSRILAIARAQGLLPPAASSAPAPQQAIDLGSAGGRVGESEDGGEGSPAYGAGAALALGSGSGSGSGSGGDGGAHVGIAASVTSTIDTLLLRAGDDAGERMGVSDPMLLLLRPARTARHPDADASSVVSSSTSVGRAASASALAAVEPSAGVPAWPSSGYGSAAAAAAAASAAQQQQQHNAALRRAGGGGGGGNSRAPPVAFLPVQQQQQHLHGQSHRHNLTGPPSTAAMSAAAAGVGGGMSASGSDVASEA